jgi:hypothetical protein
VAPDGLFGQLAAAIGQRHVEAAAVRLAGSSRDQTLLLEPVQPVGHRPAGDEQRVGESRGGEAVGRSRSAQGEEDVALAPVDPVLLGHLADPVVEDLPRAHHPCGEAHDIEVEVRALAAPLLGECRDLVLGELLRHVSRIP